MYVGGTKRTLGMLTLNCKGMQLKCCWLSMVYVTLQCQPRSSWSILTTRRPRTSVKGGLLGPILSEVIITAHTYHNCLYCGTPQQLNVDNFLYTHTHTHTHGSLGEVGNEGYKVKYKVKSFGIRATKLKVAGSLSQHSSSIYTSLVH